MKVFEKIAELDSKYSYATADAKSELKRTVANTIRPYIEDRGRYDSTEETFSTLDSVWRYEFNRIYNPNDPDWKTYKREDSEVLNSNYFTFGEGIDAIEITLGNFYNILLEVTAEDEISFSYFRYCILAEVAEANGWPEPEKDFPPYSVISYAIKFDFEAVNKNAKGISDFRKRLEYLENQLTDSRLKVDVAQDERGAKLKTIFEQQIAVLIDITNKKIEKQHSLASSAKPVLLMNESVERLELIEQGKGDRYLTFYDFNSCPIDVRDEPYKLNLADYKVTKTVEGLGDASSILAKILINIAESLQYVNTSGAKKHYDSTRLLLKTLFGIFIKQCYNMYPDDFERVAVNAKMWAIGTIGMIQGITNNINIHNEDPYTTNYDGETFHSSATKNILHFRK